jgi:hypothetical protein
LSIVSMPYPVDPANGHGRRGFASSTSTAMLSTSTSTICLTKTMFACNRIATALPGLRISGRSESPIGHLLEIAVVVGAIGEDRVDDPAGVGLFEPERLT